jgi:hypothetical protein
VSEGGRRRGSGGERERERGREKERRDGDKVDERKELLTVAIRIKMGWGKKTRGSEV